VSGFLLVLERDRLGVVDLVAVEPRVRGTGAAGALVGTWRAASPHLERIVVGTQISNVRSLRAYGKLGFRVCSATHVLHRHPGDA
jgi:RimJ/RimL family protein N-acetyltransferase